MAKHDQTKPILISILMGTVVVMAKFCAESNFQQSIITAVVSDDGNAPVVPKDPWVAQVHQLPKTANGSAIRTSIHRISEEFTSCIVSKSASQPLFFFC